MCILNRDEVLNDEVWVAENGRCNVKVAARLVCEAY